MISTNFILLSSIDDVVVMSFIIAEIGTRPRDDFVDLSQLEPPSYCLPRDGTTPLSAFYPSSLEAHFKVIVSKRVLMKEWGRGQAPSLYISVGLQHSEGVKFAQGGQISAPLPPPLNEPLVRGAICCRKREVDVFSVCVYVCRFRSV